MPHPFVAATPSAIDASYQPQSTVWRLPPILYGINCDSAPLCGSWLDLKYSLEGPLVMTGVTMAVVYRIAKVSNSLKMVAHSGTIARNRTEVALMVLELGFGID